MEEQHEKQFTEGFNNGYLIAKHEPELYAILEKGLDSKNEYVQGFVSGGKEYDIEKNTPTKAHDKGTPDRDKDFDRDR